MPVSNQSDVRSARQVVMPLLNTSYKLRLAKKHYNASAKSHRNQELAALNAALDKVIRGSRNIETRRANVAEVKRAVVSVLRALNLKASF
jgi:hypothetical protein